MRHGELYMTPRGVCPNESCGKLGGTVTCLDYTTWDCNRCMRQFGYTEIKAWRSRECSLCWEMKEITERFYRCCDDCNAKIHWSTTPTLGVYASEERWKERRGPVTLLSDYHCKGCTCGS